MRCERGLNDGGEFEDLIEIQHLGRQQDGREESCKWYNSGIPGACLHGREVEQVADPGSSVCARADSTHKMTPSQILPSTTFVREAALHSEISHNIDVHWLGTESFVCQLLSYRP